MIQKWSYKFIEAGHSAGIEELLKSLQTDLSQNGQDGWEAVSMMRVGLGGNGDKIVVLLKRPAAKG